MSRDPEGSRPDLWHVLIWARCLSLQEERKKAREEKARQTVVIPLAEPGKQETVNGKPVEGPEGPQPLAESKPAAPLKVQPVVLGTKGSFQEVLARRQAELAALRGGKTAAVGRRQGRVTPPSPPRCRPRPLSTCPIQVHCKPCILTSPRVFIKDFATWLGRVRGCLACLGSRQKRDISAGIVKAQRQSKPW